MTGGFSKDVGVDAFDYMSILNGLLDHQLQFKSGRIEVNLQVAKTEGRSSGAALDQPAKPVEGSELLKGDHSEEAFSQLVRQHATSGVSGILPKFLDTEKEKHAGLRQHPKATLLTHRHIVKGSSSRLPFATANEHLCMQVTAKVLPTAKTELSEDGNVLVVHRFDDDQSGRPFRALEDFCSLLGLRPAQKYETTWESPIRLLRATLLLRENCFRAIIFAR